MAFWRVAGFAQPSTIEQILDKEEFTLEELLDEDDIIQECKSLNGRLIAFLREKPVVEQLLRYLVQPPSDPDDPKKQYKYPFTACEVFCCEVEAVFNTLLEDEALLGLLFSLLATEPPLSCKAAGYFGRVVGVLLLRKTGEMMQYLSNNDALLEGLVRHLDVTSIADVIKRLAGADEQSAMAYMPSHTAWLVETPLLGMLLERLGPGWPGDMVANAADVLTAVAHTQPSALSARLMQPASISALFKRALDPGGNVVVPALEVCSALLRPRRAPGGDPAGGTPLSSGGGTSGDDGGVLLSFGGGGGSGGGSPASSGGGASDSAAAAPQPRAEAMGAVLAYLPALVSFLASSEPGAVQETPYGLLVPPLGRARLKVVELLAVLLAVGGEEVEGALIEANALGLALDLFSRYPFNNLLHGQVAAMLDGVLRRASPAMVQHAFGACRLAAWLSGLPQAIEPRPRPGALPPKGPLRAGYLGHATQIANLIVAAAAQKQTVADTLAGDEAWRAFVAGELHRRNELEDTSHWECGRPASTDMGELGSEGDELQPDLDLEQVQGVRPALYHRYGVLDDDGDGGGDDDDDDEAGPGGSAPPGFGFVPGGGSGGGDFGGGGGVEFVGGEFVGAGPRASAAGAGGGGPAYGAILAAAMQGMGLSDGGGGGGDGGGVGAGASGAWGATQAGAHPTAGAIDSGGAERVMEDDAVLLATSDDDDASGSPTRSAGGAGVAGGGGPPAGPAPEAGGADGGVTPGSQLLPQLGAGASAGSDGDVAMAEPQEPSAAPDPPSGPADQHAPPVPAMAPPGPSGGGGGTAVAGPGAGGGGVGVAGAGDEEGFTDHASWDSPLPMDVREGGA